jgi:hypothetical protein
MLLAERPSPVTTSASDRAALAAAAPRAGAVAGILFAVLFGASVVLARVSVPADWADVSAWTGSTVGRASLAIRLVPFACIFFLWFVGVIRDRLGPYEDKFFATVTLGSALVFVALTLASAAIGGGLFDSYRVGESGSNPIFGTEALPLGVYLFVRHVADRVFNGYAVKMAGVFMISLGTLWRSTGTMPRALSWTTYLLALVMLITFSTSLWMLLTFPAWVSLVSAYILITNLRAKGAN